MAGTSYYIGDINPYQHFNEFNVAGGLIYRYNLTDRHVWRFNLAGGRVSAADADSDIAFKEQRNLSFRSNWFEVSTALELNFFEYEIGNMRKPYTPYVFFGFGIFNMNPQAQLDDVWYDLQPLGTEGQNLEGADNAYNLTQVAIPFGVGFKVNVWSRIAAGIEWGFRRTFTDYLDDVSTIYADPAALQEANGPIAAELADRSLNQAFGAEGNTGLQRGDPEKNDWYVYTGVTLTVRLGDVRVKCPSPL